jgi:hypothetical protein
MPQYSQAIDATAQWRNPVQGSTFILAAITGASSLGLEIYRGNNRIFDATSIARGFKFFDPNGFDTIILKGAAGVIPDYFTANENIDISTTDGASVTIPNGVLVTNPAGNPVQVNAVGATLTATNVGINSLSALASVADIGIAATTQAVVAAADATNKQREVIIKNLSGNTAAFRIGDASAAAAQGHELSPGEAITLDTLAAVYAFNTGTAAQSLSVILNTRA